MYQRDVPKIKQWVQEQGPDGVVAVGAFVLATIRTPFSRVAPQVKHIKEWGIQSPHLWGWKSEGYRYLEANRLSLYQKLVTQPVGRSDGLLLASQVPGLGLVKAGFFLQCLGYETACMDSHNIKRYGIDPKVLKGKATEEKVFDYLALCDKLGTSESHWDTWTIHVAGNRHNKSLATGDIVSDYHVYAVTGQPTEYFS